MLLIRKGTDARNVQIPVSHLHLIFMKSLCLTTAFVAVGLSLLTGCSSPHLDTVNLQGSASVAAASVQVDVIGLNAGNQTLKALPVPQYWRGANAQYKADAKSFRFGPNSPQTYTIAAGDPIWKHWSDAGVTEVMVIADLPGVFSDLPGDADQRRKVIPVTSKGSKTTSATIVVDKTGLVRSTP